MKGGDRDSENFNTITLYIKKKKKKKGMIRSVRRLLSEGKRNTRGGEEKTDKINAKEAVDNI